MKKLLVPTLVTSLLLTVQIIPVLGQESTATGTTRREVVATKGANRVDKMEERLASREARLNNQKQAIVTRILTYARRMLERATNIVARLDHIWNRVASRMDKIKATGRDLSNLDPMVSDVKIKRQAAIDSISSASTSLTTLESSNEPKTVVESFRNQFKNVIAAIRAYHQAIIKVIQNLKGLGEGLKMSQTPSATSGAGTATGTQ